MKAGVIWKEKMEFAGFNDKNDVLNPITASGPTPKHLFLQSIVGCTAMDVVSILEKMRTDMPTLLNIDIEADVTEEHPKTFKDFKVTYFVEGNTDIEKLKRAIDLSQDKYCGISKMAKMVSDFSYKIIFNGKEI